MQPISYVSAVVSFLPVLQDTKDTMTYHLDVDSELRFEVEHDANVQLEVTWFTVVLFICIY